MSGIAYQLIKNNPAQFINLRRQSRYIYNNVSLILSDLWKITILKKYITSYTKYCALLHVGHCLFECVLFTWSLTDLSRPTSKFIMGSQL